MYTIIVYCTFDNMLFFASEACAKEMYTAGLARTPGIAFEYGSSHLHIAGLMAIKAAQIDRWVDLFDKIITKPLNLGTVGWWPSKENPILGGGTISKTNIFCYIYANYQRAKVWWRHPSKLPRSFKQFSTTKLSAKKRRK